MATKTPNLKPCPFCGGEASFSDPMHAIPGFQIGCMDREGCDFSPYSLIFKTEDEAVAAWNKRATIK